MNQVALYSVPLLLLLIPAYGLLKGLPVYELFVEGAAEGAKMTVRILPYVIAMLLAIGVFRSSGAFQWITDVLMPMTAKIGLPAEVLPLALIRSLSGSGALALTADILNHSGPDSFPGLLASVMQGSTDTTCYILAVYFGSVGISRYRYALPLGLAADGVSMLAAFVFSRLMFL